MIKTIIFDLGQVVISFDWTSALMRLTQHTDRSLDEIVTYFTDPRNDHLFVEGKISGEEFFARSQKALDLSVSFEEFRALYSDIFTSMPESEKIIKKLEQKYRLAILSNTNEFHFPYIIKNFRVMDYFEDFILSYEEKCQKPQYEIYQKALERLHVAPQETLFIDDNQTNVISATQIGIRAIHYEGTGSLTRGLEKYGITL
jgi:glucose-1-phosphatase